MNLPNIPAPTLPEWVKLYNSYDPEHYAPGKRVSAEEWNTLFLGCVRQGNYAADTLELLLNTYLPAHFSDYDARLTETTKLAQDASTRSTSAYSFSEEANALSKSAFDYAGESVSVAYTAETNSNTAVQTAGTALSASQAAQTSAEHAVMQSDTAVQDAMTALQNATAALSNSETALSSSITATQLSERADSNASTALEKSNIAFSNSETAIADSSAALGTADTALSNATQAVNTANTATLRAEDAIATANAAKIESASAKSAADTATVNSNTALSTSQDAKNIASAAEQVAQNALDLITENVGSQVLVNGETVLTFNADTKADVTYVNQKIDDIMGPGSTEAIDTILELAAAFKNNSDVIKVLNESISTKANASDVTDMLATKANVSALNNYVTKTGYTMRASSTVGEFYYDTGAGEKSVQIKMPTIPVTSVNGLTGDVVIDTSKYVTSDALSAVTDATLSSDNKTLTITKRNGTSFNFQGGSDLSDYMQYGDIINNLTSTATNKALSANQGKVLNDLITDLNNNKADASALANYVPLTGNSTINGNISVSSVIASLLVANGDVQAGYLQTTSAGHETGTYDKIATLSSTGYVRYRTKAELKSDLGVPTDAVTTEALTNALSSYLRNDTNGTITSPSSDTPLNLRSSTGSTYLGFINASGTALGYFGVNANKKPVFYDTKDNQLAFKSDIPTFTLDGTTLTITI